MDGNPISITKTLDWQIGSGNFVTFEFLTPDGRTFPDWRYGDILSWRFNLSTAPGERTYNIEVPNHSSLHIEQNFLLTDSYGLSETTESGPTFEYSCTIVNPEDYCAPSWIFNASNVPYDPGITASWAWDDLQGFDPQSPETYYMTAPDIVTFKIDPPTANGNGTVHLYSANTEVTVSLEQKYRQWQVNEVLAKVITPIGGDYMEATLIPLFDFSSLDAASAGYFDEATQKWITYDHFNWIQVVTGYFDLCSSTPNVPVPRQNWPQWLLDLINPTTDTDPRIAKNIDGCVTDSEIFYWDEIEICSSKYVGNHDWGLQIEDQPVVDICDGLTFQTRLVGIRDEGGKLLYDDLGFVFNNHSDFAFNWSWYPKRGCTPHCATIRRLFSTVDPQLIGNGIATIYWQGLIPPPDVNPFPFLRTIAINIKPGSDQNPINPNAKGQIPVAILTTAEHDARDIDPLSVQFGPGKAVESHGKGHVEDVNGDGLLDLVLHFRVKETGIRCGDRAVSLTGQTWEGELIAGTDSITTVGCK